MKYKVWFLLDEVAVSQVVDVENIRDIKGIKALLVKDHMTDDIEIYDIEDAE